jgi:hypothetical protein
VIIHVRKCSFDEGQALGERLLPLIPQAIEADICGEIKFESDGSCCCGTFEVRASVFVVPDGDALVLSGVGLPHEGATVRPNPWAGADQPVLPVDDLDPYELRLGLCHAINAWMSSHIVGHFRAVFPGLDVVPPAP